MDRETFRGKALAEPRTRHAHEFERMTAFAQREHFLERPMFLTAPAVGRFAVQNSQRFHCYGELRVNLDSFKGNGADIELRVAAPRLVCFMRLMYFMRIMRNVSALIPCARSLAFASSAAMHSVQRAPTVFQACAPADRRHV